MLSLLALHLQCFSLKDNCLGDITMLSDLLKIAFSHFLSLSEVKSKPVVNHLTVLSHASHQQHILA